MGHGLVEDALNKVKKDVYSSETNYKSLFLLAEVSFLRLVNLVIAKLFILEEHKNMSTAMLIDIGKEDTLVRNVSPKCLTK